jgi:glucan phosphoethanolaminetransferase (alkaline phosphatase superfamily)
LVSLFKEAGFRTAWFSSQESSLFNPHADLSAFTDPPDAAGTRPDSALLAPFADCLRHCGPRQFIVLHMYGSHFPYDARYGENDRQFTPTFKETASIVGPRYRQQLVNSYDNSLLALDRFLAETLRLALGGERPAVVLYTSDHGENLGDDERQLFMHLGSQPTRAETMVPLLLWTNAAYRAQELDKMHFLRRHLDMPLNHMTIIPTLLDLASVRYAGFDASESVASPSFAPRPRVVAVAHGPLALVEQLR